MAGSEGTRRALRRRVRAEDRLLLVVAGPNGAGKSTFVESFLKSTGMLVVNPDEVATALSPDTPEAIAYEAAPAKAIARRGRRSWIKQHITRQLRMWPHVAIISR